ncbi:hypothetical protein AB6A40_003799 [Gnathostoma spinigerum]|uniref:CHK kinase-like domain-containing protein n=1 Tax=Gnathostoma spinigerum TaxID=75299 RepID=A0ABD6EAM8_9BILA
MPPMSIFRHSPLGNTIYDTKWVLGILESRNEDWNRTYGNHKIEKIQVATIGSGTGFLSKVFRVTFFFGNPTIEPYSVVAKFTFPLKNRCPARPVSLSDCPELIVAAHKRECDFYDMKIDFLPLPKMFLAQRFSENRTIPGVLLMESINDAVSVPVYDTYNIAKVLVIVEQLARLHAFSLTFSKDDLKKFRPVAGIDKLFSSRIRTGVKGVITKYPNLAKLLRPILHFVNSLDFVDYSLEGVNEAFGLPPVLVHGDLWNNNILWKRAEDGRPTSQLRAIIDWHMCHIGCIVDDLCNVITVSCDKKVREEAERQVFYIYYQRLVKEAQKRRVKVIFSMDKDKLQ